MAGWAVLMALALAGTAPDAPQAMPDPLSLAEIETLLGDQPGAVELAWTALTRGGLPHIAAIPGDDLQARVTFFYKAGSGASAVRLDSVVNAPRASMPVEDFVRDFTLPMQRLANSEIWTLSLDVPRDVQASYSFLVTGANGTERRSDPQNPLHLRGGSAEAILMLDRVGDLSALRPVPSVVLPDAAWREIDSEALGRNVSLEIHPAENGDPDAPVLILYDAFNWGVRAPAWEIIHNLVLTGDIPPMHVVLIDQLDERSEDTAYADQAEFVADELLPFLRQEFGWRLAASDVVLGGASRRGLSAAVTGLSRPDAVGAVLSLSGSFYWSPQGEAPEWLARQLSGAAADDRRAGTTAVTPRFLLAAGSLEYVVTSTNDGHVMLDANRRMADALAAAGYPTDYRIYPGGHDIAAWRLALAEALTALYAPAE